MNYSCHSYFQNIMVTIYYCYYYYYYCCCYYILTIIMVNDDAPFWVKNRWYLYWWESLITCVEPCQSGASKKQNGPPKKKIRKVRIITWISLNGKQNPLSTIYCLSFSECFNGENWDCPPSGWSQLSCQLVLCPLHAGTFGFSIEMDGQRKIALVPEWIEWKWSDASWPQEELSKNAGKKPEASLAEERDSMNTMAAKMSETRRSRPSCSIWNSGSGGEIMA